MVNTLNEILQHKQKEVDFLVEQEKKNPQKTLEKILNKHQKNQHVFRDALKVAGLSVIAEIKRKSPFKGKLARMDDIAKLAHLYSKAGVAAISVLTDMEYFGGQLEDLKLVAQELSSLHPCPIIRKDFIIHPYQIAEAKMAGAFGVHLIVSAIKDRLKEFIEIANHIGLDVLVEVHNLLELEVALKCGAQIIGVNNRNFNTFHIDLDVSKKLASEIPNGIVKIAESGILTVEIAHQMHEYGYDGVSVGEMLINAKDPREVISEIGNV